MGTIAPRKNTFALCKRTRMHLTTFDRGNSNGINMSRLVCHDMVRQTPNKEISSAADSVWVVRPNRSQRSLCRLVYQSVVAIYNLPSGLNSD